MNEINQPPLTAKNELLFNALQALHQAHFYHRWIYSQFSDVLHGKVLDVGSGIGDIIRLYDQPRIRHIVAIDREQLMISELEKIFVGNTRYSVIKADILLDEDIARLGEKAFDVVTCSNILEHIDNDERALKQMARLLKPDGRLSIVVPSLTCLYGTLDELAGHSRRYSRTDINAKLAKAGFVIERQHYMNMLGTLTWLLAGKILRQQAFNLKACILLDQMVPFLQGIEKIFHPPFGQSLVTIARRS